MNESYLILAVTTFLLGVAGFLLRKKQGYMPAVIILTAFIASLIAGMGLRAREVVEGAFAYLDVVMWLLMGGLFCAVLADNGSFDYLLDRFMRRPCGPVRRLLGLLLIVGIPGMLTGSALASVASTGLLVGAYLQRRGLSRAKAVEVVAGGAFLGMVLPPLCAPAILMVIGRAGSYNAAFEGFFVPLLALGLPALIVYALLSGKRLMADLSQETGGEKLPGSPINLLPLAIVFLLILGHNFLNHVLPFLGYPLIYLIGILLAVLLPAKRVNPLPSLLRGAELVLMPASLMFATGALNEVMWMTGVNGDLNTLLLQQSELLLFLVPVVLVLLAGRLVSLPFAWALCAVVPNLLNGAGYQLSSLRLLAAGAILAATAYRSFVGGSSIFSHAADKLGTAGEEKLALAPAACTPVVMVMLLALVMGIFSGSLNWLMI